MLPRQENRAMQCMSCCELCSLMSMKRTIWTTYQCHFRSPWLEVLILTHIFLGRPEKPITIDMLVNQSPVAPGLSRCFIQPNGKMWIKDRLEVMGSHHKVIE